MKVITTDIEGVKIVEPDVFGDERGWFCETYSKPRYEKFGIKADFVQDNESMSSRGVVRGLHWQAAPFTQAKLVRVERGAVLDVAVDIREGSPTYGRHVAVELSSVNRRQLFIPKGFAHGFFVLEDDTVFSYKCDEPYNPGSERGMRFDDPDLGIKWPDVGVPLTLSPKDRMHPPFKEIEPCREKA
ncbi:MAG: dTDP-4-dehydrorhamnose 3,5-epimerase [Lentisphaerae bacterium]|jgi:dTDP-4-dehydrorhamnose 3,5-epimerase|nr:dTDP-4-dehydrorhamnose 3,5-epimerase [Lentisphaerota bacterium]